jgi:lipoprotein-anchoring transpeptidase ErfK/SrfK
VNTLKPLLTVAVLAGIGYGVYIRLNTGGNGPPPVAAGWNNTPAIQLPEQNSMSPWQPGGSAPGQVPSSPPATVEVPAGQALPYQPSGPSGSSEAPPFGGAPPAGGDAPPFNAPPAAEAPQYQDHVVPASGSESAPVEAGGLAPSVPPMPSGNPYEQVPPDPASAGNAAAGESYASSAPPADPYPPLPGDADPTVPSASSADPDAAPAAGPGSGEFAAAIQAAQRDLETGQLAAALRQLTPWYASAQLSPPQQQHLQSLLDQVAGTVVYSTQNHLEHPYEVQPGERLESIGEKYQVPWQLLAKINGIADPAALQPGERLKVVRGPFEAEVSLQRRELVLRTADGLYAGRFPVGLGAENPPQEGSFAVSDKVENPVYYGREKSIAAEDPSNPLGERWIGLGRQMAIHGTNDPQAIGRTDLPGWISLREQDVEEVFDILSLGSRVTIVR